MQAPSTITRFCIYCDKERQVHAETGRCQSCGKRTATGEVLERLQQPTGASNGQSANPSPPKLVLTETASLRKWVALTREVATDLAERAQRSADSAKTLQIDAQRLQQAATAFGQLLGQIGIEPAPTPGSASVGRVARLNGRWSQAYDACIDCGRTDRKYAAHGRCRACDSAWRQKGKA